MEVKMTMQEFKHLEFMEKQFNKLSWELRECVHAECECDKDNIITKSILKVDKDTMNKIAIRFSDYNEPSDIDEIIYV